MEEIAQGLHGLWEKQPVAAVLLIVGVVIFLFLVFDAWHHKHRRKKKR